MKKIKSFLCVALLSIALVGNVFGASTFDFAFNSFFGDFFKEIVAAISDDCTLRTCGNCKPFDMNCRPEVR